jgi:hypothetical protein
MVKGLVLAIAVMACVLSAPGSSPAVEYHVTCVGHGFVAGSSPSDGSFFSRIETGCGTTARQCKIYNWGTYVGSDTTTTTTCNAWSNSFGSYTECASYAKLNFPAAFSEHNHTPDGYCAGLAAIASARVQKVEPLPDEPMADSAEVRPAGTAVIGATAPDPDGGPDFAVRVYPSETGMTCPEAGRVKDGVFGQQYPEGWQELPVNSGGSCADLDGQPVGFAVANHPAQGDIGAYALVFGSVSEDVVSVSITLNGTSRELPLSSGTFIAPTSVETIASGATLTVTLRGGSTVTHTVPVPDRA